MTKTIKEIVETAMPGWKMVEETPQHATPAPVDQVGPDIEMLRKKYGIAAKPEPKTEFVSGPQGKVNLVDRRTKRIIASQG